MDFAVSTNSSLGGTQLVSGMGHCGKPESKKYLQHTGQAVLGLSGRITSLASGLNTGGNGGMRSFVINTRLNF